MRQLVQMRLPADLVRRVDEVAGERGRTEFTIRALTDWVGAVPGSSRKTAPEKPLGFREWYERRHGPYPGAFGEDPAVVMARVLDAFAEYADEPVYIFPDCGLTGTDGF